MLLPCFTPTKVKCRPTEGGVNPSQSTCDEHTSFDWSNREHLASVDAVAAADTRFAQGQRCGCECSRIWGTGKRNPFPSALTRDHFPVFSRRSRPVPSFPERSACRLSVVWSPSRLEAWLKCPRQAWLKQYLRADDDEDLSTEDIDVRIRGQVVHETEAAILQGHGIPMGEETSVAFNRSISARWVKGVPVGTLSSTSFSEMFTGWGDKMLFRFIAQRI